MVSTRAVFTGASSLLIHCAQAYQRAGHCIAAVITFDQKIAEWALAQGIRLFGDGQELLLDGSVEFDFLFALDGHDTVPADLVRRASAMALGFYDSPCPAHASLYGPNWALIDQQKRYGVCWHEMKLLAPEEAAVKQAWFDIADDDTAWSLRAKCYEAGFTAFVSLIDIIDQGRLSLPRAPALETEVHALQPLHALGTLDFSRSAKELTGLVAGLDFGPHPNPLALAKIYLGNTFAVVRAARTVKTCSLAPPGTVLRADGNELQVATHDGDIVFSQCSDAAGQALKGLVTEAMVLPAADEKLIEQLDRRAPDIARGELYWQAVYRDIAPVELPYPRISIEPYDRPKSLVRVRLASTAPVAELLAAFCAWLSGLTVQKRVSILYSDPVLVEQAEPLGCWLSAWAPMTLSITPEDFTRQAAQLAATQIAEIRKAGPCTRDLPLRIHGATDAYKRLAKIGVCLGNQPLPEGMDFMLAGDFAASGVALVADQRVFSHDTLAVMGRQFAAYLASFKKGGRIGALPLITDEEAALNEAINNTFAPYENALSVEELIAAQVRRTPDHEAVCFEGMTLSYRALEDRSAMLASRLRMRGVGPGHIIGLCLDRGIELVVSLLAIVKTGAAYLPLDPDYPHDRLIFMMEDSQTAFVLTTRELAATLAVPPGKTFLLDAPADIDAPWLEPAAVSLPAARMAYLMYTSGSTGRPKGVMVTQQNMLNLFAELDAMTSLDPPGRWLAIGSVCFDISVPELWWTLTRGFTVVIHSRTEHRWSVAQALSDNRITHFFCTPSMASMLVADGAGRAALSGLSMLMVGGEALPLQLANDLCGIVAGRVYNIYGPTETTVFATACELSASIEFVPLGRPIANTTLYVRNALGAECPAWVPGELLIGGDGVSNGYWRRLELSAERFIPDPRQLGRKLYRTGDLVRRHPDGALEFLGRIDHQVKIRGHRIELGEIENVIGQISAVNETVVLADKDKFGDLRLVAYVVAKSGHTLQPDQIQQAVAEKLPAIMVPGIVLVLQAFALTPNGKIDRRALPSPKAMLTKAAKALPESSLEISIAEVWSQVLGARGIKATDNFFELGGSFFLGIQAQQQLLESTGHFVPLADLVRSPTVRELAQHLVLVSSKCHQPDAANEAGGEAPSTVAPAKALIATPGLTHVESVIAEIWRDLFEIEMVDRNDDFFNLGGNSLAAVRMFAQLRKQLPVELPLSTLFEASSLAGFAALVENSRDSGQKIEGGKAKIVPLHKNSSNRRAWSPLVQICRGERQRKPLFCIHGAGGNVFNFKSLSQKFGVDQPVYGLHPQGVDGHRPVLESIEAMAAQYVKAIRSVDPHGPYQLLGYSAGGVIAFEMAQQLRKTGHRIALLAMIDTLTPAAAVRKPTPFKRLWLMRHWSLKFATQRFKERHSHSLLETSHAQSLERLTLGEWLTPEMVEPYLFRHIVTVQGRYKPEPYHGPMVLYKALDATTQYLNAGQYLGWEAHIDGQIKIISIPGSHNSMMEEQGLTELGMALKTELDWLHAKAQFTHASTAAKPLSGGLRHNMDNTAAGPKLSPLP